MKKRNLKSRNISTKYITLTLIWMGFLGLCFEVGRGQGLTIGICRIHTYTYFYWRTHDFGHAYIDAYAHFFPIIRGRG